MKKYIILILLISQYVFSQIDEELPVKTENIKGKTEIAGNGQTKDTLKNKVGIYLGLPFNSDHQNFILSLNINDISLDYFFKSEDKSTKIKSSIILFNYQYGLTKWFYIVGGTGFAFNSFNDKSIEDTPVTNIGILLETNFKLSVAINYNSYIGACWKIGVVHKF